MTETGPVMKCKIVFLGDQSVGKTSIINRFIFDNFTGNEQVARRVIQPTVGVDFVSKTINVENKTLRMQLWDTAGQERFHSLIPSYIKDSHAAIIVYDITNENSYSNIVKWVEDVKEVRGEEAAIFILGNKVDLDSERYRAILLRKVSTSEATKKIQQLGLEFAEVSAKTGANIKEFFKSLAHSIAGTKKSGGGATANEPERPKEPERKQGGNKLVNPATQDNEGQKKKRGCC